LHKKLNETRDRLNELEEIVANRRAPAGFKQILAEAKLNHSMAPQSPMVMSPAIKPEPSNCPPSKQARMFSHPEESPHSEAAKSSAVPTALQQTPQANTRKSHQQSKIPSALKAFSAVRPTHNNSTQMSTPTRKIAATPKVLGFTPQVSSSVQRRNVPSSALRAVANTPNLLAPIVEDPVEMNPLHGPVQLKSVEYIKWAQQLEFDPNWLNAERVPKWNPLSEDYLDKYGPTAGQEKTELKRKAGKYLLSYIASKLHFQTELLSRSSTSLTVTCTKSDNIFGILLKSMPSMLSRTRNKCWNW
jgi:hypothetical protein